MKKEASPISEVGNALYDFGSNVVKGTGQAAGAVANFFSPPPTADEVNLNNAINNAANSKIHTQMGKDILAAGAGGLGVGILATRLHQILANLNKPKEKHTKFAPGAHPVDDDEKIAETNWSDSIAQSIGSVLSAPVAPAELPRGADAVPWSDGQKAVRVPAALATAGLSLLAGHKLMDSIYAKKKKEELNANVQDAKKEYERALMGKRGSVELDRAFEKISGDRSWGEYIAGKATEVAKTPFQIVNTIPYAREMYWTGLLGSSLAAGKMTYDWTRERSRDKAIERARRARARMAGTAPVYVDPEQLVAVKKLIEK